MSVMRIKDAQGNWQEVAALHGLPGTSVSITSISESTEDDGYSVVTFSDGKQLRVKNGSKGSPGEGGAGGGGGVMTVVCTPTEDGTSFTANKSFEEIGDALLRGQAVQAYVQGLNAVAQMFMFGDNMVVFSAVASLMGDNAAVTLMMMKDGTNTMSMTAMGGMVVANITTEDGETYTTNKTAEELYAAVSAGMPVYASLLNTYIPAHRISDGEAVFRVVYTDGTVTVTLDNTNVANVEIAPAGGSGGGGEVIVDVARDGDVYTTSMQADAIYTAYAAGKRIVCRADLPKVTGMLLQPTYISDVLVVFTGAFTDALFASDGSMVVSVAIPNANTAQVVINTLDKLPNPEPLTINGTSYDGSEAVNIDIAAGGGGNKWTSFYTNANIGGTNRAEYKTDRFGRSFAFSAAMVEISVPAASSASWADIAFWNDEGTSTTVTIKPGINTTASLYRVYCYVDHGRTKIWCPSPVGSSGDAPTDIMLPAFNNEFVSANTITRVIVSGRMSFPANTYCTVWGVNA